MNNKDFNIFTKIYTQTEIEDENIFTIDPYDGYKNRTIIWRWSYTIIIKKAIILVISNDIQYYNKEKNKNHFINIKQIEKKSTRHNALM